MLKFSQEELKFLQEAKEKIDSSEHPTTEDSENYVNSDKETRKALGLD